MTPRTRTGCARCSGRATVAETLKPFQWMQCHTTVQGFTGGTEVDLALPCTYDFDVTGRATCTPARRHGAPDPDVQRHGLHQGEHGFGVAQVPWDSEAATSCRSRCGGTCWLRSSRHRAGSGWTTTSSKSSADYRARHGLVSWEETVTRLLAEVDIPEGSHRDARRRAPAARPRGRRRGALRGLPALPLPGELGEEPGPLAVRGAGATRGSGPRGCRRGLVASTMQSILTAGTETSSITVHLRFLQLQHRQGRDAAGQDVASLRVDGRTEITWDEAVEQELDLPFTELSAGVDPPTESLGSSVNVEGGSRSRRCPGAVRRTHAGGGCTPRWRRHRAARRLHAGCRAGDEHPSRPTEQQGRRHPHLVARRAPAGRGRRLRVRLADRPARRRAGGRGPFPAAAVLAVPRRRRG